MQVAVANALKEAQSGKNYFEEFQEIYTQKRDLYVLVFCTHVIPNSIDTWSLKCHIYCKRYNSLVDGLEASNMRPVVPDGGFFVLADSSVLSHVYEKEKNEKLPPNSVTNRDFVMCRGLIKQYGVGTIPPR